MHKELRPAEEVVESSWTLHGSSNEDGFRLGNWVHTQRKEAKAKKGYCKQHRCKLNEMQFKW